jgi:formate hydrogenlyase subunit 3/multisubunit Na+/H+ antiporter MnhD subunit
MRNLFVLLALLGLAGIVLGVLAMMHGAAGPHGIPFRFENYGGPGSIIAGLIMLAASLYLRSAWPDRR